MQTELTKLNIPQKINVGFQIRADTYTGKLAFIVYTDSKGAIKKQKSWDGWRDHKIEPKEFDNVPTSGFVLNKKVGGTRYGWNPRQTYVRIWDSRDFEFEISVPNLLFILQETSAIKGKGLEGEFVYAWDGTTLLLLPVDSQEYQESSEFTSLQTQKVTQKEMVEGCLYQNKENKQVMYLGRHDWWQLEQKYANGGYIKHLEHSKLHIFVSVDGKSNYWPQTGFTKLAKRMSEDPSPLFAEEFEKFKNSIHGSEPVDLVEKPYQLRSKEISNYYYYSSPLYLKEGKNYYNVRFSSDYAYPPRPDSWLMAKSITPISTTLDKAVIIPSTGNYDQRKPLSTNDVEALSLYTLNIKNKNGALIQI